MSLAALEPSTARNRTFSAARSVVQFDVSVTDDFDAVRLRWEQMVASGHATPYQQFGFIETFFRLVESAEGAEAAIIEVRKPCGAPVLLLPLSVTAFGPARVARFIGGGHCNFNMPVCAPRAADLTAEDMQTILHQAGAVARIDVFALTNQPGDWQGFANPLRLLGGQPSPSMGFKLQLQPDSEALFRGLLSKDARRKLRQKDNRLSTLGTVAYVRARDVTTANAILDSYFALRAARFAEQGIDNPFASAAVQQFFRDAACAGLDRDRPVVELHALQVNGAPVAIFGVISDRDRMSGVITAFGGDAEVARCSPGDLLLHRLIADACARDFKTFDLGVGEARYKSHICNQVESVTDAFLPVTFAGRAAGVLLSAAMRAKRSLKQSDFGREMIARVRKWKTRG